MNSRILIPFVVCILSACGESARCASDRDCTVESTCDAPSGACITSAPITPLTTNTGGGTGSTPTGSGGGTAAISKLPPEYGRACLKTADCGDIAGTTCISGYCANGCGNGEACTSGTQCLSTFDSACLKRCDPRGDQCDQGMTCQKVEGVPVCVQSSSTKIQPSPIGGECVDDGDCEGSSTCLFAAGDIRKGVCTSTCTHTAECGPQAVCILSRTATIAHCMAKCENIGEQSSCRAGFVCRALEGSPSGACMPN